MNIAIIGAGEIGRALAHVFKKNAQIEFWDKDSSGLPDMKPLKEVVRHASVIFLCIPSWAIREVALQMKSFIDSSSVIVSLAKGIEQETFKTMDAVLGELFLEGQPVAVLGGPLLAEELLKDMPGVGIFASKDSHAFDLARPLFDGTHVRLEYVDDPRAVALVSVFKNVYAVALGIAEGLCWGWNAKGWLASRAMEEMRDIVVSVGSDSRIASGPAGAGDFLATAMSPDSRNRTTGIEIARTGRCEVPSEGCRSLPHVIALLGSKKVYCPILTALDQIINKHEEPKTIFQNLFTNPSFTATSEKHTMREYNACTAVFFH